MEIKTMPMSDIYDGDESREEVISKIQSGYKRIYWLFVKERMWKKCDQELKNAFSEAATSWRTSLVRMKKFRRKTLHQIVIVPDNWKRGSDVWLFDAAYAVEEDDVVMAEQPNWTSDHPLHKTITIPNCDKQDLHELLYDQIMAYFFFCYSYR